MDQYKLTDKLVVVQKALTHIDAAWAEFQNGTVDTNAMGTVIYAHDELKSRIVHIKMQIDAAIDANNDRLA